MGFSYPIKVKDNKDAIINFNKKYKELNNKNSEIEESIIECFLHNIGQEGFNSLCSLKLDDLTILYLSENNISNIESFGKFHLKCIKRLDLSYNKIKNIDIFEKVEYPLEYLDLQNNIINNIDIFKNKKTLKSLKTVLLNNNDLDFDTEEIKNILSNIRERAISNNESISEYSNNEDYRFLIKKVKTINDKLDTEFCLHDKDIISKMRKSKNLKSDVINDINELEDHLLNFKKKSVNIQPKEILILNENEKKKNFQSLVLAQK